MAQSTDNAAPTSDLGVRWLACQDDSNWLASSNTKTKGKRAMGRRRRGAAGPSLGTAAIDVEGLYSGSRVEFGQLLGGVDAVLGIVVVFVHGCVGFLC